MIKRPFATIGITYLVSQAVAVFLGLEISLIIMAVCAIALTISLFVFEIKSRCFVLVAMSVIVSMGFYCIYYWNQIKPTEIFDGQTAVISGVIDSAEMSDGKYYYIVQTDNIGVKNAPQNVKIRISSEFPLEAQVSDRIEATVRFIDRESLENSTRIKLCAQGINVMGYIPSETETVYLGSEISFNRYFESVRSSLNEGLKKLLPEAEYSVARAMMFGDKSMLSDETSENFRVCGLSHLFAVSGLHLSIIIGALIAVMKRSRVNRTVRSCVLIAAVVFFMGVAGFSYSVMRAGLMQIIVLAAAAFKRDYDAINSLGAAAFVICLLNPTAAVDVGFQLSFATTFSIIALHPIIYSKLTKFVTFENRRLRGVAYKLLNLLSVAIAAGVMAAPVSALYFGEISLVSLPATVLCLEAASAFLIMCVISAILSLVPFLSPVAAIVSIPTWLCGKYILTVTDLMCKIPYASTSLNYGFFSVFVCFAAVVVIVWITASRFKLIEGVSVWMCAAVILQMFMFGMLSQRVVNIDRSYIEVYSVDNGIGVAAVYGNECVVVGVGGDEYSSYKMTRHIDGIDVRRVNAVFFPQTTHEYASGAETFIDLCEPKNVFVGSGDDELIYDICKSSAENECAIYSAENALYSACEGNLSVESFRCEQGFVWTYIVCGDLEMLICPADGDAAGLPEGWRKPDCAVMCGDDIVNVAYLDSAVMVISGGESECSSVSGIFQIRGVENIMMTSDGDIRFTKDGSNVRAERFRQ